MVLATAGGRPAEILATGSGYHEINQVKDE